MKPNRIAIFVVLVGMLVMAAALWFKPSPNPTAPPELPRASLVLTNGVLCQFGETTPFTGWMFETNLHGGFLSRSFLSNGVLEGISEGWHTNGQLQVREQFRAGVSEGLRTKWDPNGAKLSEATIVNGKVDGSFRRWHTNGILAEEVEMKSDQAHGRARSWYPSGSPKADLLMRSGRILEEKRWLE